MKKLFTLFAAALMAGSMMAADVFLVLTDSILLYNAQDEVIGAVYYTYNEMGARTSSANYSMNGGQKIMTDSVAIVLNEANLPVETILYANRGVAMEMTNKTTTVYDVNGNVTSLIICMWVNNAWQNYRKIETVYDANNKALSEITSRWKNNAWVDTDKTEATYNNAGQKLTSNSYSWNAQSGAWQMEIKTEFIYKNNLPDSVIMYTNDAGEMVYQSLMTYTYNVDGKPTEEKIYVYSYGSWGLIRQYVYAYDANGFLSGEEEYYISGTEQQKQNKADYTYDAEGHLLEEINYGASEGEWAANIKRTYAYDENGNETQANSFAWDATESVWNLERYEHYFLREFAPTAIENTAAGAKAVKVIENGQVVILRDGKKYTLMGVEL